MLGALAVALLLVLAGCSSLGGAGGSDRTAYDVPSRTPSVGGPGPPGVANDSVESPFLLVQSHVGTLSLDSFHVVRERTVRRPDGTVVRAERVDARVSTDRQQYHIRVDRRGTAVDPETRVVYASVRDGVRRGVRQATVIDARLEDGQVVSAREIAREYGAVIYPEDVLGIDPNYRDRLYRYLTVTDDAVVRPLQPGVGPDLDATTGTRYQVEALTTSDHRLLTVGPNETVANVSVRFVADERGLILEMVASYVVSRDGERLRVTERIAYPALGNVSVTRPDWFDRVADEVAATATTTGDRAPNSSVADPSDDSDPRDRAPTDPGPDLSPPSTDPHDSGDDRSESAADRRDDRSESASERSVVAVPTEP